MRKTAAQAFYLAVFTIFSGASAEVPTPPRFTHSNTDVCALDPQSKVHDACASFLDLDKLNHVIQPFVRRLANNSDFFSYYRLNLYKECPFWSDENGLCGNIACSVTTVDDEKDLPEIWRVEELSKLEGPKAQHPGKKQQAERQKPLMGQLGEDVGESCVVEYDDECDERDYCVPEDESATAKGDYVSLADNPERFTGYSGEGAHQVWEAIYHENCFSRPPTEDLSMSTTGSSPAFGFSSMNQAKAAMDFKQVMRDHDRQQIIQGGGSGEPMDLEDDECLEKRVFHRIISGMHSSISTHLCYDYLNQTTGEWGPNLECYKERLHHHPERISNLYFNYALVLRAVGKLKHYVQDYTFCTGDPRQDTNTKTMISALAHAVPSGPEIFDENVMFQDQTADGISLKEDFRNRFRNVSRIMDCVGCDKCRLWGKLQTAGYGTALKVLFEFGNGEQSEEKPLIRRTEMVALINTLDKISSALKALQHFREMISAEDKAALSPPKTQTPKPSEKPKSKATDELDDLDDMKDSDDEPQEYSLADDFWNEFGMVWKAVKFVLQSWVEAPGKFAGIAKFEAERLYDRWLGRPLKRRTWSFELPTMDEL